MLKRPADSLLIILNKNIMSLHYIIDGYNVIKQVRFLMDKKLRGGRDGLLKLIERYRLQGSIRNEVSVVFDGKADVISPQIQTSLQVIFSKNETADEKIKRQVERSSNPRRIVVVSDDKQLTFYCRSLGAKIKSVKEFLNRALSAKGVRRDMTEDHKPELNSDIAIEITEYLKSVWLKDES